MLETRKYKIMGKTKEDLKSNLIKKIDSLYHIGAISVEGNVLSNGLEADVKAVFLNSTFPHPFPSSPSLNKIPTAKPSTTTASYSYTPTSAATASSGIITDHTFRLRDSGDVGERNFADLLGGMTGDELLARMKRLERLVGKLYHTDLSDPPE